MIGILPKGSTIESVEQKAYKTGAKAGKPYFVMLVNQVGFDSKFRFNNDESIRPGTSLEGIQFIETEKNGFKNINLDPARLAEIVLSQKK